MFTPKRLQYQLLCSSVVFLPWFHCLALPIAIIASRLDLTLQALEATVGLGHSHLLGVHGDGVHHFGEPWGSDAAKIREGRLQGSIWEILGDLGRCVIFLITMGRGKHSHSLYRL